MGIALLCIYLLLLVAVARSVGGRDSAASFFVNNRSSSAGAVALSIIASCVGASATLGVIGKAFAIGVPAFWWLGAGAAGLAALALLLAEKVRESGAYTLPQLTESFLGKSARPAISMVIVVAWLAILAAQFVALKGVLVSMTALSEGTCLGISFALIVLHTLGGQGVIIRLDGLQSLLILSGVVMALAGVWAHNPGWTGKVRLELVNSAFGFSDMLFYLFVVGANYLVCPMLFGRLLSAKDEKAARRGGLQAALGLAGCSVLIVCVGLACNGLIPASTPQDEVFIKVLDTVLPTWMRLVILLTLVSAIVSSADACLITAATVLSYDLLGREDRRTAHLCVTALGAVGVAVSLMGKSILEFLLMAYDLYACGVVVPVFIGLLCKKKAVPRPRFVCAAILGGGLCGVISSLTGQGFYSYLGMGFAGLATLMGMRFYAAPAKAGSHLKTRS